MTATPTPAPTGRLEQRGEGHVLLLTRTFRAPVEDVWAAVTEPDRLARWIGTFTGDPAAGRVMFQMTAEEGAAPEEMEIRECTPPHALKVTAHVGDDHWLLDIELTENDGITTLTFSQPGIDPAAAENVGPGWEYYLDRLVAAESGGDPSTIDFERDYYPAMQEYYQKQI
ncbi:SRPBCC family protein [Parafrankia sp. FMc2]|uniref:SRPBCC family protein n=1 Tax=Parafrankia sp. FMc2 TaxID=3233196 RepID=UPI0034D45E23